MDSKVAPKNIYIYIYNDYLNTDNISTMLKGMAMLSTQEWN